MAERRCALYVHIPFCVRKCAYCDFTSYAGCERVADDYLAALAEEARSARDRYGPMTADTVYIGGGTPSILTAAQIERLLVCLRETFNTDRSLEFTCEANPGTLTPEKLAVMRQGGVSRLSLGVQAFDDRLLRALGRIHTADEAARSVLLAHEAGFDELSVDLMYALPDQTRGDLKCSLHAALSLPISHISCYSLIVEERTPMHRRRREQPARFPDDDEALAMQRLCADTLGESGFERYEISNYAPPGHECRHNMTYWHRGDYLGLGVAAHSLMEGERFSNTTSLADYLRGERAVERQVLTARDVYEETVMLGLRTREGVDKAILPKDRLDRLVQGGFMTVSDGRARVTARGADVLNALILELI